MSPLRLVRATHHLCPPRGIQGKFEEFGVKTPGAFIIVWSEWHEVKTITPGLCPMARKVLVEQGNCVSR